MKYKVGQTVHVRTGGLIVPGVVKEVEKNGEYIVEFEGGSEKRIKESVIRSVKGQKVLNEESAPKLDSQTSGRRTPSRRSPARSTTTRSRASPSPTPTPTSGRRSPGRTRARKSVSPARKSPGRPRKASPSPSRNKSSIQRNVTPTRILKVSLENIDASGDFSSSSMVRRRKPIQHDNQTEKLETVTHDKIIESEFPVLNLPPKLLDDYSYENNKEEISHQTRQTRNILNDIGKFSDDDEIITDIKLPTRDRLSEPRSLRPPKEFGGWFGAFILMLLIPTSVLSLHVFCNKNSCSFKDLPNFNEYKLTKTYFDVNAFGTYLGYLVLLSIISKIPYVGRKLNSQPSKDKIYPYRMNGLFSAFVVLALIITLEIRSISVVKFLLDKYFQLLVSSLSIGFFISILLFIKSKFVPVSLLNPYASTYNFIYDFFMGRQVNPRIFKIDIKMILLRASYIIALIYNSIFLYKSLNVLLSFDNILSLNKISLDPQLLACAVLQILYVLDLLLFEAHLTTTFELQYEGLGYMKTLLYAAYPFYITATTKYLYEHNSGSPRNILLISAICLVYLAGYLMYRGSNSQKNAFRLNPHNPALSHLDSMPTGQGKKLLISGWWGRLRHPNYSGDVLMHLAIGALCAGSPAGLAILPPTLLLAIRAVRDSSRCRRRYGTAWDRYVQKVRYNIIPCVY